MILSSRQYYMSILGFVSHSIPSETTALIRNLDHAEVHTHTFLSCLSAGPILRCWYHLRRCTINCPLGATGHNLPPRCGLHPGRDKTTLQIQCFCSRCIIGTGSCAPLNTGVTAQSLHGVAEERGDTSTSGPSCRVWRLQLTSVQCSAAFEVL